HSCADPTAARLVTTAYQTIQSRCVPGKHQIGAAILDDHGRVWTGIHLEATVDRHSLCAEGAALALARLGAPSVRLLAIAAVRYPKPTESGGGQIVSPCRGCRELLSHHAPDIQVVVPRGESGVLVSIAELFPEKHGGTQWPERPTDGFCLNT
ncbi:hypothetical protein, partial [Kitasatospora sp. GP82]|uniref:hypothetical protein n=1 Tax=Kitasatospora sp. GP82 TaxID=3035089 RepID=UPI002475E7B1